MLIFVSHALKAQEFFSYPAPQEFFSYPWPTQRATYILKSKDVTHTLMWRKMEKRYVEVRKIGYGVATVVQSEPKFSSVEMFVVMSLNNNQY